MIVNSSLQIESLECVTSIRFLPPASQAHFFSKATTQVAQSQQKPPPLLDLLIQARSELFSLSPCTPTDRVHMKVSFATSLVSICSLLVVLSFVLAGCVIDRSVNKQIIFVTQVPPNIPILRDSIHNLYSCHYSEYAAFDQTLTKNLTRVLLIFTANQPTPSFNRHNKCTG
jgi:hypothetical protein